MRVDEKKGLVTYGKPAMGCIKCVRGEKLVLFITGLCGQKCFYCPISEEKFGNDSVYANEWQIESLEDLREEIRLTDAKGAGITGGDPLVKLNKTCEYIQFLKKTYGKEFHIHLYTPFKLVTDKSMKKLYEAGLDEIRFHAYLDEPEEWKRIKQANKYNWDVGIEIPCLPNREEDTKKMVDFFANKVKFINLNELEFSDTVVKHYNMEGKDYKTKNEQSYGVKGSRESAENIIRYAEENKLPVTVYFCSAHLKDKTQMGNRIKRRAQNVAKEYDTITDEGMLIRGVVFLKELLPKSNYRNKLKKADNKNIVKKLENAKKELEKNIGSIKADIDKDKLRLTMSARKAKKFAKKIRKLGFVPGIVEEYPTKNAIEVEIELFLDD